MKTTNLLLFCAEAGFMILVGEMRETRRGLGIAAFLIWLFRGDQLLVAPQGDFLDVEKVTKDTFRRRGLRFPRLLKTSTLEPPKRNHCDGFPLIPSKEGKI